MTKKKTYLFTLTITPVQSFISQSRKTKDLFSGSEILAELIRNTLKEFDKYGNRIFPQDIKFVSNKFVGKLENKTQKEIEDLGKELENSINNKFMKFVFNETCKFDSAFKNFFTIFWVAVELGEDYKKSYNELEQNLGAIKNLRTFEQTTQPAGEAKCVLCGERNQSEKNKGDKLCLICYTKRICSKNKTSYPSTAKIALLDWLPSVEKQKKYQSFFKKPFDESLYFKENLSKEYLQKWDYFKNDDGLQKAIKFLDNLDIETKQKKYYALIQFDIDDMGKKLSELDEKGQKDLSNALGEFTKKAKDIVDKNGRTIYAGGDDFLGFVNLAYLFEVIKEIKESFNIDDLTYSTSIVITHYKTQLDKVLKYSRMTLENAKNKFKTPPKVFKIPKNAMGITYITKSNNISTTYFYKERAETFFLLNSILKDKTTPILSSKFIFNLEQEFKKINLENIDDIDEINTLIDMINIELKRLLKRASADFDKDMDEKKKQLQKLYKHLSEFTYDNWNEKEKSFDFENYIKFFKIADAINGEK